MKKKTYEQPQIQVIEVKAADIICTSDLQSAFSLGDSGDDILEQGADDEWGDLLNW